MSETTELYEDFWTQFVKYFENTQLSKRVLNEETTRGTPVFAKKTNRARRFFHISKRGEILSKVLMGETYTKGVYVEILLEASKSYEINKELYHQIKKDENKIDKELSLSLGWKNLGLSLEWDEGEETERSKIFVHNKHFNPRDKNDWKNQHEWIVKTITEFERVFTPFL